MSETAGTEVADLDADPEELAAQVEVLAEENQRLREEYARARRSQYRRTAIGLGIAGLVGLAGAVAFPAARTVLLALGATGVFAGLLTLYLTPERFVAASASESVYRALAATGSALVSELGLAGEHTYVPLPEDVGGDRPAVLFVPQHTDAVVPDAADLADLFVVTEDERGRGIAVHPTGAALVGEFERALAGPLADAPAPLSEQLADGLVEQFELVDSATPEVDAGGSQVSVAIRGSSHGSVDRFDHPVGSFLAVGLAIGLDEPVVLDAASTPDGRADYLVTCSWGEAGFNDAIRTGTES